MLVKTRGIVLGFIKYKETSIIVNIYTEALGLKSYIVNGVRDKKNRAVFFQPLTMLDLVVYDNSSKGLNRISEYTIHKAYHSCMFDYKKIAVVLFLAELLNKTLKEEHPDEELFVFVINSLILFDETPQDYTDFHILFLLEYASYLGIRPSSTDDIERDFGRLLDKEVSLVLNQLIAEEHHQGLLLDISNSLRRKILEVLTDYYELHFPFMGRIQSLTILKEVFS